MIKQQLGRSDIEVAPLALGGNVFGWTADEKRSFEVLDAFVAAGFNFIDTADMYSNWVEGHSGGESEATIGRWLARRGRRDACPLPLLPVPTAPPPGNPGPPSGCVI